MRPRSAALVLAAALLAGPALAGASQAGDPITAAKREGELTLDGKLDEAAWAAAPAFDGFVQLFPTQGARPSEGTEVRVLYDDRHLHVGVIARDREPHRLLRPLGRRDSQPYSDMVAVIVDPRRDGRLGYYFEITAAGVLTDGLIFDNDQSSFAWDAVWEGAAAPLPDGWSAEVRIPLSVMRFSDAPVQTWGFAVKRVIGRSHEELLTCVIPRASRGQIARLGPLVGLADMQPVPDLQITPYVASRLSLRPTDPDQDRAAPRLADPVAELGFDVRASLGRALALNGTVNPDFGQVEADEIIQNLSSFEAFFPEKRPFFQQGMDLFEPVKMGGNHDSPQRLFYSRRVGLDAPILAAAKLTGQLGDEVQIGVLESVVTGSGWGGGDDDPARPPRDLKFSWSQPFRVGPGSALPQEKPASRNFLVAVGKWQPAPNRSYGLTLASALPLGRPCSASDYEEDDGQPRCEALGGNALAADWSLRSGSKEWYLTGQLTGSQAQGGPPSRTLGDGTVLDRGDLGWGGFVALGRNGGRGLRGELHHVYSSPGLDLNATGFQRTQNEQFTRAYLLWVEPDRAGPFQQWNANVGTEMAHTTDVRHLNRWGQFWGQTEFQTRGFHWFGFVVASDLQAWDVRELWQTGHAQRRPTVDWVQGFFNSDGSKAVQYLLEVAGGRTRREGPFRPTTFWGAEANVRIRPHPRFETRVGVEYSSNAWPVRYVDDAGEGAAAQHVFADLKAPLVSATLRQQVVLTPRLTLQAYAQLFTSYGRYGGWYVADANDTRVGFADVARAPGATAASLGVDDPDFRDVGLNVNLVMRWEYRAGSTLFVVYSRAQGEPGDGVPSAHALRPQLLAHGPTTDTFLVKWTYFWNR